MRQSKGLNARDLEARGQRSWPTGNLSAIAEALTFELSDSYRRQERADGWREWLSKGYRDDIGGWL